MVTERLLDPLQRNIDQVLAQAVSPGATSDIKAPLAACLDRVICKVDRDTRDDKLLARCYDLLAAARDRLAGDRLWTTPGAPNASAPNASAPAGTLAAGSSGQSGPRPAGGLPGEEMPPLPPNWDMHRDGAKTYYINQKTQQRLDTRPVCQRESIKQLLNVISDIFTDSSPQTVSLIPLAREMGEKIEMPKMPRKAIIMVIGNGARPQTFIEHYTGKPMRNAGLGCMHAFSIVSQGSQTETEKGDLALQVLNVPEVSKLRNIKGIDRSVLAEQVMPDPKFDRDLEKLVFVRAPSIEGPVKVTGTVQAAMQAIRQYVASSHAPLKAQLLKSAPNNVNVLGH